MLELAGSLESGTIGVPLRGAQPGEVASDAGPGLGQPCMTRMDPMRLIMADSVRCQQDQFVNGSHVLHSGVRRCS